jgi:hypothetical protein
MLAGSEAGKGREGVWLPAERAADIMWVKGLAGTEAEVVRATLLAGTAAGI